MIRGQALVREIRGLTARMTTLERINLHHCKGITDKGVRALAALPALRELTIEGSRTVTRGALTGFAPSVRVMYSTV